MSNLRDAIVRMALRRPYLYLLVTLVISIVLMEVLVEIAEPVDHDLWLLGRGRIVQPDQWPAINQLA